jgi:two-component system OmpR family response regulator
VHHILLAIDDAALRNSASDYLSQQGYLTSAATSREAAAKVRAQESADVLILDAVGYDDDSVRVCRAVRSVSSVPIIVLTPRDDSDERVRGLEAGIDDYLVKPFNPRELIARIKVVSRRASFAKHSFKREPQAYRFGEWTLDVPSRTLWHSDGSTQVLTASDFRLLETLVTHAQKLLPLVELLRHLHGPEWQRFPESLATRMSRLRRLLRDPGSIRSVYGAGYVFERAVETDYLLLPPGSEASWLVR